MANIDASANSPTARLDSSPVDLIAPIFALLIRAGQSKDEITQMAIAAIDKASSSKKGPPVFKIGTDYITADLIHRWLRDPSYINASGKPKDLPFSGTCSFRSLVIESDSAANPDSVVSLLLKFGTVKKLKNGNYRLVRRSLNFTIPHGLPFEPNFRFLLDAVRSCTRGLAQDKATPNLYWYCADSVHVSARNFGRFLDFAEERSLSYMHEINDWLDQHAERTPGARRRKGARRVGVGLFSICEPVNNGPTRARAKVKK